MTAKRIRRKRQAFGLSADVQAILSTSSAVQNMLASGINTDGSLKPEGIRALLKLKGITISSLASERGVSVEYMIQVINRQRGGRAVEDLIAEKLGLPADQIWGRRATPAA